MEDINNNFWFSGPRAGCGQGIPAVLGGCGTARSQQSSWRSPEGSGHLQRQPGRHRSVRNLQQLSRLLPPGTNPAASPDGSGEKQSALSLFNTGEQRWDSDVAFLALLKSHS